MYFDTNCIGKQLDYCLPESDLRIIYTTNSIKCWYSKLIFTDLKWDFELQLFVIVFFLIIIFYFYL